MGRSEPLGEVDPAKLNVDGGSIAISHPAAEHELHRGLIRVTSKLAGAKLD